MRRPAPRVLVIGLDCAAPRFVFGPDAFDLPNLRRLMERGAHGALRSCDPPITIPAWACMTTGLDPGTLGCYGFQHRRDHRYFAETISTSQQIVAPRIWDRLGAAAKRVAVVGVPQTYPVTPVNGALVSGFLTPDTSVTFTHPPELGPAILNNVGDYAIDAVPYRTDDKEELLRRLHKLLDNRFAVTRYLLERELWDFAMMVEIGLDRLHHGFWRFCDAGHPRYEKHPTLSRAFEDYYRRIDDHIGGLLSLIGDEIAVMVVSDHGARPMQGAVNLNEWLRVHGWLALSRPLDTPTAIRDAPVDWTRTKAWALGGYCARIYLNLEGRQSEGSVRVNEYDEMRTALAAELEAMPGPEGQELGNRVVWPERIYREVNGIPPDLIVYLGDLAWRASGDLGVDALFSMENNTGPDDANHDFEGIVVLCGPGVAEGRVLEGASIFDIAPTVLDWFGLPGDARMSGRSLCAD